MGLSNGVKGTPTFFVNGKSEQTQVEALVAYGQSERHAFSQNKKARAFVTAPVSVFPLGDGRYDFASSLRNPNTDWYATFDYFFSVQGEDSEKQKGFILPGEEKPLVFSAYVSEERPARVEVFLKNIVWRRVDAHQIADYQKWQDERLHFSFEDIRFSTDVMIGTKTIGQLAFRVKNETAFNYWEPEFLLLLIRGNTLAGISSTTLREFMAGEEREVQVNWFGTLPAVSKIEIIPSLFLFDPTVYMPLEAGQSAGSR